MPLLVLAQHDEIERQTAQRMLVWLRDVLPVPIEPSLAALESGADPADVVQDLAYAARVRLESTPQAHSVQSVQPFSKDF
jgi:hypothetical protein